MKWLLAAPHYIVLGAHRGVDGCRRHRLGAVVITGRCPRPLFNFIVGFLRWTYRVLAYAFLLATDEYPPFRLGA